MKTQTVTPSCFLSVSGGGVVDIVFTSAKVSMVFKVDGIGYFRDFVLDRETWSNKLVTFPILIFFAQSPKNLGKVCVLGF